MHWQRSSRITSDRYFRSYLHPREYVTFRHPAGANGHYSCAIRALLVHKIAIGSDLLDQRIFVREIPNLMLREHQLAIHFNVEDATGTCNQNGINIELCLQLCSQTGRDRLVVSSAAIGDGNVH